MSTIWMAVMVGTVALATGTIVLVAARLVQALRAVVRLEQQVTRLQEGTNLLTETMELGFQQYAAELERLAQGAAPVVAPRPPAARATTARVKAASARGRSIREIAAAEQVSEGEVRLRLSLAEAGTRARRATPRTGASKATRASRPAQTPAPPFDADATVDLPAPGPSGGWLSDAGA